MSGTVRESPADFRNGDLISRLLAATPPYQTNSTFVPPGLYFSEMLKRFVQAKSCPPSSPNKRGRKRSWKDATATVQNNNNINKADLHLHQQQQQSTEPKQKKTVLQDFVPIPPPPMTAQTEPPFPLWYPPFYPGPAYPPVYFKTPEPEPLNLHTRSADPLKQDRHYSAFRVPEPSSCKPAADDEKTTAADNRRGTSYLMGNLTKIYRHVAPEEERIIDVEGDGPEVASAAAETATEKKDCKDLTALIGLELVVDYVKHGNNKGGQSERSVKCCENS